MGLELTMGMDESNSTQQSLVTSLVAKSSQIDQNTKRGSAERDVGLAKAFWSSVTLQPLLESHVGPVVPQEPRRKVVASAPRHELDQILLEAQKAQKAEEKEKYLQKAKRRDEILALLRKQREERITKELIARLHKPKTRACQERAMTSDSDVNDQETVKALD